MADRKAIEARIAELRGELSKVEGTPTEVYSRIVGYYRSVRNWNAGKREEYGQRLVFGFPSGEAISSRLAASASSSESDCADRAAAKSPAANASATSAPAPAQTATRDDDSAAAITRAPESPRPASVATPDGASLRNGVLVFTREVCPNCPPVKNFVVSSGVKAVFVDVEREEGFALAKDLGVMATPTVLGIDEEGHESFRAFDLKDLRERIGSVGIAAAPRLAGSSPSVKV